MEAATVSSHCSVGEVSSRENTQSFAGGMMIPPPSACILRRIFLGETLGGGVPFIFAGEDSKYRRVAAPVLKNRQLEKDHVGGDRLAKEEEMQMGVYNAQITAASNGMEAWKVLEDLSNHIDLVLTEVVMPYLSGIGLLCKITSHKTCKNIPVIMAAMTRKIIAVSLESRDGSDNGSGTQNSWTKRAVEVDSPQPMSSSEQLAGTHDSTCAQVIYPKPETLCSNKVKVNANINGNGEGKVSDDIIGKNLEISPLRNTARNESYRADKVPTKLTGPGIEKLHESGPNDVDLVGHINSNVLQEPSTEAIDLLGGIVKNNPPPIVGMPDSSKVFTKTLENKKKKGILLRSPQFKRLLGMEELCVITVLWQLH
ncbi:hypothetical protein HPP92_013463 [Vanilla planifolia]|uniref:Response regulatory domain-containing protein n=1 Tax=Vanilla planifolia TaxID=51239 RepID=A0A835QU36_VANPL|nr:hypothetical protein HPP92_013463 [Vanilla planifolia]